MELRIPPRHTLEGVAEAEVSVHQFATDDGLCLYLTRFRPMKSLFAGSEARMLMKLIVERSTDKVVGCHIVGEDSPEMIQLAGVAVKAGLTKAQWDDTCALHPSAAEELVTLREKYVPAELAAAQ